MQPKYTIVRFYYKDGKRKSVIYTTKYWKYKLKKSLQKWDKIHGEIWWIEDTQMAKDYTEAKRILNGLFWLD